MKISFRQGIVRRQTTLTAPDFLRKSSLTGTSIDLIVSPEPTVITFAHYTGNYLFEEGQSIIGAWGSSAIGSTNGPLTATGQTQYLYWDVNMATGELTRGWTLVPPIVTPIEPTNPVNDTHWFDTELTRMRVYRQPDPTRAGAWQDKIRLFAGTYDSSANIISNPIGSQVGITGGEWSSGNIILGANNKPLKQSDGTFVTTESSLIIYQTSGQNVKFDMTLVYAQASEDISKFSLISFQPDRKIGLASSNNINSFVSGIIVEDLYQDEVGQVISNGVIRNEQWDWTAEQINKPLFCGPAGELRLSPPTVGALQQVGYVYEQDAIYLNLYPPVRLK